MAFRKKDVHTPTRKRFVVGSDEQVHRIQHVVDGKSRKAWQTEAGEIYPTNQTELR